MTVFTDDEVRDGMVRLGRSPDGKFLRQRLMQVLIATEPENCADGALRSSQGRRSLALTLLNELELTDGRTGNDAELARRDGAGVRVANPGLARRVPFRSPDDAAADPNSTGYRKPGS